MRTRDIVSGLLVFAFGLFLLAACSKESEPAKGGGQSGPAPGQVTLVGTVLTTDDEGEIELVTLTAADGTVYRVTLDAKGKALGRDRDGERVEVTGSISVKDGEKWLTVTAYKLPEAQKAEEVEGAGEPEEGEPPAPPKKDEAEEKEEL